MDEANFIPDQFVEEVVIPPTLLNGCAVIAISTPSYKPNWFMRAIQHLNDEYERFSRLFCYVNFKGICDECMKKPKDEMYNCPHNDNTQSRWKSDEKQQLWAVLCDPVRMLAETKGILFENMGDVFEPELIRDMLAQRVAVELPIDVPVYLLVDPNGGGHSNTAVVIATYRKGETIVWWMDNRRTTDPQDMMQMLTSNVLAFRRKFDPQGRRRIYVATETNASFSGDIVRSVMQHAVRNVQFLKGTRLERTGFIKDGTLSALYISDMQMSSMNKDIKFHKDMGTANRDTSIAQHMKTLEDQLVHMQYKKNGRTADAKDSSHSKNGT